MWNVETAHHQLPHLCNLEFFLNINTTEGISVKEHFVICHSVTCNGKHTIAAAARTIKRCLIGWAVIGKWGLFLTQMQSPEHFFLKDWWVDYQSNLWGRGWKPNVSVVVGTQLELRRKTSTSKTSFKEFWWFLHLDLFWFHLFSCLENPCLSASREACVASLVSQKIRVCLWSITEPAAHWWDGRDGDFASCCSLPVSSSWVLVEKPLSR